MTGYQSKKKAARDKLIELAKEGMGMHSPDAPEYIVCEALIEALAQPEQEPVAMRMPKVGDRVVCIEDESLATVQSLTAGGSPDIKFDDGSHGTYLLREFAELFRYASTPQRTWVEPTGNEWFEWWRVSQVADATQAEIDFADFLIIAQAVMTKLKEHNNG